MSSGFSVEGYDCDILTYAKLKTYIVVDSGAFFIAAEVLS